MNWVEHIRNDGDKALRAIYKEHRVSCLQWLGKKFSLTDHQSLEIFQQAVVILYDNVMKQKVQENKSSLKTYLFAIAKFKAYEFARYKKKWVNEDKMPVLKDHVAQDYEDKLEFEQKLERVSIGINELGDPCKTLLQLFYYQQLKLENITHLMGYKNVDTTKNLKYKCMKRLRKLILIHKEVKQK